MHRIVEYSLGVATLVFFVMGASATDPARGDQLNTLATALCVSGLAVEGARLRASGKDAGTVLWFACGLVAFRLVHLGGQPQNVGAAVAFVAALSLAVFSTYRMYRSLRAAGQI